MKGINLKKIGAILAGSAILASSVAFAGLVYQNTPLVDANGQPVVKIVVGERAAASDGVVAAYIASKIANEAYKSSTMTAEVVGAGTCTGASGTGTCSVVAGSEKVTLLVTVPGAGAADRADYSAGIGDYLDRDLLNRYTSGTDADEAYTVTDSYSDTEANPYQDYIGGYVDGTFASAEYQAMVKVGSEFGPFAPVTIQPRGSASSIQEGQYFTFSGKNYWDTGDKVLKNTLTEGGYTAVFAPGDDYGLPLCPGDPGKNLVLCGPMDELPSKKVFIKFLGEDWVISEVTPADSAAGTTIDQQTYHTSGSKIKLAKEAVSGIINVGEILDAGNGYKVRLDDIARESDAENAHPAIVTVLDSNDNEVCQDQVFPDTTVSNLCDTTGIKLHVYQTAPGVMLIAKWAELGIFSDEITLEDGQKFISDSDSNWDVLIGWENKGTGESKSDPEYLRTITLYTDAGDYNEMVAGDKFPVVDLPNYEKFDLTYNGIDDSKTTYDDLKYKIDTTGKRLGIQNGTASTDTCYINITDPYVKVTTSQGEFRSNLLIPFGSTTSRRGAEAYWLPYGAVDDTCGLGLVNPDSVVLKDSDGKWWVFDPGLLSSPAYFDYRWAGSNGELWFNTNEVWLGEDMGKIKDGSPTPITYTAVDWLGIYYDTGTDTLLSIGPDNADDEVTLQMWDETTVTPFTLDDLGYTYGSEYEAKFVSPRGTQFVSPSKTSKSFKVPKDLLKATYTFATSAAANATPDTTTLILGEGDEATVGTTGVKVKVLNITESLTPCTFGTGAGAAPTCDMSGVSAVIMPNNAPSVQAEQHSALTSNMVVLDSAATGLDTGTVITVGGDVVNTVTAGAIAGQGVDFAAQPVVVRAIGNKIVVAGLNAQDTISAAQQFVAGVTRN